MILLILLLTLGACAQSNLPVRTGIVYLRMISHSQSYSIVFKSALPNSSYTSVVFFSYIQDFSIDYGINMNSTCLNSTATGMICTMDTQNQYNFIYMSYLVSGVDSLIVGSNTKTFFLQSSNELTQNVAFKPIIQPHNTTQHNFIFWGFYSFIAGLNSLDGNCSLKVDRAKFNPDNLSMEIGIILKQFNAKNITITFGYMLFDATVIMVSLYEGLTFHPGNVPQGFIYGIQSIYALDTPLPPKRLLQIHPRTDNNIFNQIFSSSGFIIMAPETQVDQIYFYEVDPLTPLSKVGGNKQK